MKQLDGLDPEDPKFDDLLGTLIGDIRHHVEDEENDLLPKLHAEACSDEQLRDLGEKVLQAKRLAPTHPHPSAPDKPPPTRSWALPPVDHASANA